ncbi:MAG: ATP-dependent zinc metalloprotease FtsH [Eubacterium sp.]|nr:ATP-dependent zinc metalloprotease FtsH [Eubacterium sp.]
MADNNNNNPNDNRPGDKKPGNGNGKPIVLLIISIILTLIFVQQFNRYRTSGELEVSYDRFLAMVEAGKVESVKIYSQKIYFQPVKEGNDTQDVTLYVIRTDDYSLVDKLQAAGVTFCQVDEGGNALITTILSYVLMIGVFYIFMMLIMRKASKGGGIMNIGKSNAKLYDVEKNTGVTFKDVAGQEESKESLKEMVDFLNHPDRYVEIGAKLPKGALLVGPPGTGKTLLAKAVAGEAKVPFFSISGSEFVEMYVGLGASRVRDLFKQATQKAPCIIFIDEIDAIGRSRDTRQMGGDSEREQTLNQLLAEMDGFDSSKGIIILAATNRPEVLDKALLRPGRFDRRIVVERPDISGREDILRVHSKNVKLDETVDLHELALATSGAVGADLANIINEAALSAVRHNRKFVSQKDLIESVEVVFAGKEKKDRVLSEKEKRIVAYHEAGHALLTAIQKATMPVQKITIVPRTMGALGYVWQVPEEEKYLESQDEMEAHIVIACGGRAAEALKFPSVTSGAANDIEQATKEARAMVTMYGMSEKFGMVQLEGITGEYLDRRAVMNCSDETATKIDTEVRNIIKHAYNKAFKLLKKNEPILDAIAEYLIEHETISGQEFMDIYNKAVKDNGLSAPELKGNPILEKSKTKEKVKDKEKFKVYKSNNYPTLDLSDKATEEHIKEREARERLEKTELQSTEVKQVVFDKENNVSVKEDEPEKEEKMVMPWETFAKGEAEDKTDAEEADDELVDLDSLENDEDALSDLKKMDGISEDKE